MISARGRVDPALARLVTVLAAIVSLALAIIVPAAYLLSARATMHASLQLQANLAGNSITQLAINNPELWVFENARLRGLLSLLGPLSELDQRLVLLATGEVIAEQGDPLAGPIMTVASPIYDSGVVLGRVEVRRSQHWLLINTFLVAVAAGAVALTTFMVLRVLPLRLLQGALARSAHLATHDTLTGLPNRALFRDRLDLSLAMSRRERLSLAVFYVDLDHFKDVNDTLGHAIGDRLLVAASARLRACLRESDTLARLGGDEFAIIQVGVRQVADTEILAQRLVDALSSPFEIEGHSVSVSTSVGVTVRGETDLKLMTFDAGILLQEADVALYRAKEDGRATYRFFRAEMNDALLERRKLEADMREALEKGEFLLHYQPQLSPDTGRIIGAEALIRWPHPRRGNVAPDAFIHVAEQSGLIMQIGEWVLHEACRQAAAWPDLPSVAVNVSPIQFRRPGFVDLVERALRQAMLAPQRLEIEITEGVLMTETPETLSILNRLHDLGVKIAMDDFGTGYSSLGYLQKFQFDKIKIDRSFVSRLGSDQRASEIVRAVLRMSHAMGIKVTAEGVEDQRQVQLLQNEGCEEIQGFLCGKPMPAAQFSKLLWQQQPAVRSSRGSAHDPSGLHLDSHLPA
ncbi:MAG: EAL domain-containing protein [Acetobacteraceae bacterium]|nr:EAL domain-containing protein [Pseudomonadota bacterium]